MRSTGLHDICVSCKTKVVDFFIFKRRNEDARKFFHDSRDSSNPPVKSLLLDVVDQLENELSTPEESHEGVTELGNDDQMLSEDELHDIKEEFLDTIEQEDDETQPQTPVDDSAKQDSRVREAQSQRIAEIFEDDMSDVLAEDEMDEPEQAIKTSPKRSRRSKPESWKRNRRKHAKNTGKMYVSSSGKIMEAKQMKPSCGTTCRMQCSSKITESSRLKNFELYYQLADIAKQRKFLYEHTQSYEPRRKRPVQNLRKVRALQRFYYLDLMRSTDDSADEEVAKVQVCRKMFLNTFGISSQMIDTLYRMAMIDGEFSDTRGKFERKQSKPYEFSIQFLDKLRCNKQRHNSASEIYDLYCEECQEHQMKPLSEEQFTDIYNKKCKILFKLEKTMCSVCDRYENAEDKSELEDEYEEHLASSICEGAQTSKKKRLKL